MKKILVAGAGHGGLTAAVNLAKKGFDVTVIEKNKRENLGHDWHDWLTLSAFDLSGIERPDESMYQKSMPQVFRNPSLTRSVERPVSEKSVLMDRKVLINYLTDIAEKSGVKFLFQKEITAPVTERETVKGVKFLEKGKEKAFKADLVVDAAGMYSPVKTKLPLSCGIERDTGEKDVFHVFRAYYKNSGTKDMKPSCVVSLFHLNRPGIDWTVAQKGYVDILIGKFGKAGKLTRQEVDEALSCFRKEFPFIEKEILRGGSFEDIPIMKMPPLIVCDGYAAVGDSAGMTVPLSGSGIVLSMNAGKILADTVIESGGRTDKKSLWKYQYEYYSKYASRLVSVNMVKNFCTYVTAEQVDFFLEKNVLTSDLFLPDGSFALTKKNAAHVVSASLPLIKLFPPFVKNFIKMPLVHTLGKNMPRDYDEQRVDRWVRRYKLLS